eukprot:TRINITY_DN8356_c0_g1_i3.p1 TRINITY_DN8356_c0_g1~~TRINITY_DN8356_c0_g1_i3.p1  ORF type:complete len:364 (-),score=71.81 TRINITY_DN8356_c0_g1_i3:1093-2184(-)
MASPAPKGVIGYEDIEGKKGVTVYLIELSDGELLKKRYSEFREMYLELPEAERKKLPPFPAKTGVMAPTSEVKAQRVKTFDVIMKEIWANPTLRNHKSVVNFFNTSNLVQAGGHGKLERSSPGFVTKKTDVDEVDFYRKLSTATIPDDIKDAFFPKIKNLSTNQVTMEDLTFGFECPCIMDVKMGTITAGEDANFFKKSYMVNKDKKTTSSTLGLRLVASRVYDAKTDTWRETTRADANQINNGGHLETKILEFFQPDNVLHRKAINSFLPKLNTIHKWMEEQTIFRFYSSSLLFVYEGHPKVPFTSVLKMIGISFTSGEGGGRVLRVLKQIRATWCCRGWVVVLKECNMVMTTTAMMTTTMI